MEKFRKDRHSNGEDKFDEDRASWSNTDSYELIATLLNDTVVNKNRKGNRSRILTNFYFAHVTKD